MIFGLSLILAVGWNVATSAAGAIQAFGYEGSAATITCPTEKGYESYEKYFCGQGCTSDSHVLVTTSEGQRDRYSIANLDRYFVVNIFHLRRSDAGRYWCGVSRNAKDIYTEVSLKVEPDHCCEEVTEVEVNEEESASFVCRGKPGDTLKYLCKGSQPSVCLRDALITSRRSGDSWISLSNGGHDGQFVVRIQNVKPGDSGRYLCGVQRKPGPDAFHAFMLKVKDWCCVKTLTVTSTAGEPLTIQCQYQAQTAERKVFVCRGERRDTCIDVAPSARMELRVDPVDTVFQIIIREVTAGDAGTYWCGAEPRWTAGTYTKYHLTVDVPLIQSTTAPTAYPTTLRTKTAVREYVLPLYVIVPAVLGFLLVALVALLLWRCKRREPKEVDVKPAAEGEPYSDDNDYENLENSNTVRSGPLLIHNQEDDGEESVYQNAAAEQVYSNVVSNKPTSNLSGQKRGEGSEMVRMNRK